MNKLFKLPGVFPYLTVVFLNAFVDLGHKITIQNTIFKVYDGNTQVILTAIVNGLILLPFILLFSPSGFIADRYPKNQVMRLAAWAAVVITIGITLCYYLGWFWPAFGLTFLLAIQSAIYSPAKYGYIKSLFGKEHLAEANGLVQSTTIVAILLGTFAFSILFESWFPEAGDKTSGLIAIAPIGWLLIINSIVELLFAYRLPQLDAGNPAETFKPRDYITGRSLRNNINPITSNRVIRLSVIGLAVFWSVGQVMLAAFPAFAKENLAVTNTVVIQGIIAATGIGIAVGSTLAGKWSKGHIETGLIPLGAAGVSIGLVLLPNLATVISHFCNFLFIGVMGGLFIVPLNALIQFSAKEQHLGKVLAGNNLIQNLSMLSFLILTAAFAIVGIDSQLLLSLVAIVAVIGGLYTIYQLPQSLVRIVLMALMSRRYKVDVQGIKNIPSQGGVLMLGNHISWIDWAIVQIASPRPIRFVMLKSIYDRWYLKGFFKLVGCIPIESGAGSKNSLQLVAQLLDQGEVVCLFPEGAISRTGHLTEFRKGYEKACSNTTKDIVIVPFYLRGLWGSQFSRSSDKLKGLRSSGIFRDIIVAFGEPLEKTTSADVLKRKVFDLSISAWHQHVKSLPTLPHAWIDSAKRQGSEMAIADSQSEPMSATRLLVASIAFSKRIKQLSPEQNIGLLLPTSPAVVIANMATLLLAKTVVNLNYTASNDALLSAIDQADIKTIYTSRLFLHKLAQKGVDLNPVLETSRVIYMEDLKTQIGKAELLRLLLTVKCLPAFALRALYCRANDAQQTAAILFSSGSEGAPKGVMLSHMNIMANLKQISDVLNTQQQDVVMASLPLFHAFGLTVTQFMPLIEGLPMICQPDPTDALATAKSVAKYRATIMFGTSTFLRLYTKNRKVHPLMLDSLRIVVAGAERLNEQVRQDFLLKFNKPILEGYGATETTPVASVNLPDSLDLNYWQIQIGGKVGTVGMPVPGTSFKIIDPDTEQELATNEQGMIIIGGMQVMQGYLNNPALTESVIRDIDGQRWYITGDKGSIDEDGFLTIIDRYSRFAKIGGEIIGLGSVEQHLKQAISAEQITVDENFELLATSIGDAKKGEAIVLLCTEAVDLSRLKKALLAAGGSALAIPSQLVVVEQIPKLGSGKTDYAQARALAETANSAVTAI
jgi:acyl-[acyl-carrier-protein]-phospholipid O-acyltransferase/long-chain-fatty-acid--[acyl-carrier-protein] ligase